MRRERSHTETLLSGSKFLSLTATQISNGVLITNLPQEFDKKEFANLFRKAGQIELFICCREQAILIFASAFGKECAGIYDRIRFGNGEMEIVLQDLEARDVQNMGNEFEKIDVEIFREEEEEDNGCFGKRDVEERRKTTNFYEEGGGEEGGKEEKERRGNGGGGMAIPRGVDKDQNNLRKRSVKEMKEVDLSIIEESDIPNNETIFSKEEISFSQQSPSPSKTVPPSTRLESFNIDSVGFSKLIQKIDITNNLTKKGASSQSLSQNNNFPSQFQSKNNKDKLENEEKILSNDRPDLLQRPSQKNNNNKENIDPLQLNQSEGFSLLDDSFTEKEGKDEKNYFYLEEGNSNEILKTCNFNEIEENNFFEEGRDRLFFDVEEEGQEKIFHTLKIKENSLKKVYLHQDIFRDNVINAKYVGKVFLMWIWSYGMYMVVSLIQKMF